MRVHADFVAQRPKLYNRKEKRVVAPWRIPHFAEARVACMVPKPHADTYLQKYL